jgi:uncharacterized protein involved in cysteine biosynthesis
MTGGGAESGGRVGLRAAAAAPFLGLRLVLGAPAVRRPFLRGLLVSLVATVLVFGGALWGGFALVDRLVGAEADPGLLGQVVAVVAKVAAVALLLVASPVLFTLLLGIVGGPFLTAVHAAARAHAGGAPYPELSARADVALAARGVGWGLRRLLRFLAATAACALLALIPLVGLAAAVLLALLSAHTLAWELLTPHFEARGLGWAAQRAFLRRRPGLVLGLGGVAALLLLVPLAQPLVAFGNQAGAGALSARIDPA